MKLQNVVKARSVWLFDTLDLNPGGLELFPIMAAIQQRYHFVKAPRQEDSQILVPGGIQFADGSFPLSDGRRIAVANLTIYNDGLVADTCANTFATDEFLDDVLQFCAKTFTLAYEPLMVRKRGYISELIVTTSQNLTNIDEKLKAFAKILSEFIGVSTLSPYEVEAVRLSVDHSTTAKPGPFIIERQSGVAFAHSRYYSQAPLRTIDHLDLLTKFEEIVLAD